MSFENNEPDDGSLDDSMKKLIEEYKASIPQKLQKFEELINNIISHPKLENIKALREFAHKIAGNAGTYGFVEVSTRSKEIVIKLEEWMKNNKSLTAEDIDLLKQYLAFLKQNFVIKDITSTQTQKPSAAETQKQEMSAPSLDESMKQLIDEYKVTIPEKLKKFEELINNVISNPTLENIKALREFAHKTAGSAGTYGFSEVSIKSKEMVTQLEAWMKTLSNTPLSKENLDELKQYLEFLKQNFAVKEEQVVEEPRIEKAVPLPTTKEEKPKMEVKPEVSKTLTKDFNLDLYIANSDEDLLLLVQKEARTRNLKVKIATDFDTVKNDLKSPEIKPRILILGQCVCKIGFVEKEEGRPCDPKDMLKNYRIDHPDALLGLITTEVSVEKYLDIINLGIDYLIEKPFSVDSVLNIVESTLPTYFEKRYKVLILDDDKDICEYVKSILSEINVSLELSTEVNAFYDSLKKVSPDLILLDLILKETSGMEVLKTIRSDARFRNTPVIMITSKDDVDTIKKAYDQKVDDFIIKPLNKGILQSKVLYFAYQQSYKEILQTYDPLTGVYTKRAFMHFLGRKFEKISSDVQHCLAYIGVNEYENLLKDHGHDAMDKTLVNFSNLLLRYFSSYDLIGKINESKLSVFLENTNGKQAMDLLTDFIDENPIEITPKVFAKLSSGISVFPNDGKTMQELIDKADNLYLQSQSEKKKVICLVVEEVPLKREIFILEDDEDILRIVKFGFTNKGFEVVAAKSVQEALNILKQRQRGQLPSLIILDRLLPDGDGLEVYRELKKIFTDLPPVLVLSKLAAEKDVMKGLEEGAVDYLIKPFNLNILLEKAIKLLDKKK